MSGSTLLESIESPADLRVLGSEELQQLAAEIRECIVRSVCVFGGHLGSNLGVVELTLAIHRVFDSPNDMVLWDTGHQAYVHKLVTGRRKEFRNLRQRGGLSGYPSRAESPHDWVENSHASTILSYAQGLAEAVEASGTDRSIVAVVGDGSLTGGMAFEALNNLGHTGRPVVIVLNDNGRSYAPTASRLSLSLTQQRVSRGLIRQRTRMEQVLREVPAIRPAVYAGLRDMHAAVAEQLNRCQFFEAFGIRYQGPYDGHDIEAIEGALRGAAAYGRPVVVHVMTTKGKGYLPAEIDEEKCLHDAPVFDPMVGPPRGWSAPKGYGQAFSVALVELAERDPRIHAITAAMAGPTGLLPFQTRFPDRFHDVGIAEQHAVTMAAGMAMGGLRPVVAIYSTFFARAFDQANLDVGLHRLPVVFVFDRAGITGDDGPSHHGVLDLSLCLRIPGMTVMAPSSVQEVGNMLSHALAMDGPVAIRWPKGPGRSVGLEDVGHGLHARCVCRQSTTGADVCLLAVGKLVPEAADAAGKLEAEGVSATVWDIRVVKPLDPAMIESAFRHRLVVTVEDGVRVGGAGSTIAAALSEYADGTRGRAPQVLQMGTPDRYLPQARPEWILADLGLDGPGIAQRVLDAVRAREP
jgi:1-deoxy-D-xylulose-5-phosphate synthase